MLVAFFLSRFSKKLGKEIDGVSEDTMSRLIRVWLAREHAGVAEHRLNGRLVVSPGPVLSLDQNLEPS